MVRRLKMRGHAWDFRVFGAGELLQSFQKTSLAGVRGPRIV